MFRFLVFHSHRPAICAAVFMTFSVSVFAVDDAVRLNSLGFFPNQEKRATIAASSGTFSVIRLSDNEIVLEGEVSEPVRSRNTREDVHIAEFSSLSTPGEYVLEVPDVGRSPSFTISNTVYNHAYQTVMQGMYLWRCGTAVSAQHEGDTFAHATCHLDDAYLDFVGQSGERKDGTKGWHDAGDYNKYIVNAGVTVGAMIHAWEQFPAIRKRALPFLPKRERENHLPDFLDELKWEIDWVLTMQADDGSVYHKLSATGFSGFIMPEAHNNRRYFVPWGSAATADFTAMTAMAGRIFESYLPEYAERCKQAAKRSYRFLQENPENHAPDQSRFSTGGYNTSDPDDRLWAAAEMWQTFGDETYLHDFESRARQRSPLIDVDWDWNRVGNLGIFTYLLSEREGRDPQLTQKIKQALIANADSIVETRGRDAYERPLGTRYYWGCNGTVARQCLNLMTANRLAPNRDYVQTALAALSHLFGRNYYNRSYVTGLGINPPQNPHCRRSGADDVAAPWPGYLVGGGHSATGWEDVEESYQTNEIAINWNGALVYALSAFVTEQAAQSQVPHDEAY